MRFEMNLVLCVALLTGSSLAGGQRATPPPILTLTVLPGHVLSEDTGNEFPFQIPDGSSPKSTISTQIKAVPDSLSSTPDIHSTAPLQCSSTTESRARLTSPSHPTPTSHPTNPTAFTQTWLTAAPTQTAPTTHPQTQSPGHALVGPTPWDLPSELNVGDEDFMGPHDHSRFPLDPLLAGLLSVFIVMTAVAFVILFLRFRQRSSHPEFHRLQDLPMDNLMEDTPLSQYTY